MATTGHENEVITVSGLKTSLQKLKTDHIDGKAAKANIAAGDYNKVTVNAQGIVTAGSNPTTLAGHGILDAYTKTETNGLVDTPHQNYVTVQATDQTTAATDVLPASGQAADTIYRVSNWDGSANNGAGAFDVTVYSEYAWDDVSNPNKYVFLCVKTQIGEVFDISVYNNNATYADLAAALGASGANVPAEIRRGGMSVKFVHTSDNNYVRFNYLLTDATNAATFTNVANWQSENADSEPVAGSNNIVTSGGVYKTKDVIVLKVIQAYNVIGSLNIGEFGYNTTSNEVVLKTIDNVAITFEPNIYTIYKYNGHDYKYNGTTLVLDTIEIVDASTLEYDQGGFTFVTGAENRLSTRIKSKYINKEINLSLPDGFVVKGYCYFSKTDGSFVSGTDSNIVKLPNSNTYVVGSADYLTRIVVARTNASANISPSDIMLETNVPFYKKNIDTLTFEQGALTVTGNNTEQDKRLRSVGFISGVMKIGLPSNVKVYRQCFYSKSDYSFVSYTDSISRESVNNYIIGSNDYLTKIVLSKYDTNQEIKPYEVNTTDALLLLMQDQQEEVEERKKLYLNMLTLEQGAINTAGQLVDHEKRVRTAYYIKGTLDIYVPDGFRIWMIVYYDSESPSSFSSAIELYSSIVTKYTVGIEGKVCKVVFAKLNNNDNIAPKELVFENSKNDVYKKVLDLEQLCANVPYLDHFTKFDTETELFGETELSNELSDMSSTGTAYFNKLMEKYDSLVSSHSDYVVKVDAAEELNLVYPEYANLNGEEGSVTHYLKDKDGNDLPFVYSETPTYKVYLYKFADVTTQAINQVYPKKKVLIISNLHGNETAAPFNLYLWLKQLCECRSMNFSKVRSRFDIYVIPCLNVYGAIHNQRTNANYVDINRNFGTKRWAYKNIITSVDGAKQGDYTGETPDSEFETKIVEGWLSKISPTIYIDHHNYGYLAEQLYTDIYIKNDLSLCYQAFIECSHVFIKNYPAYFGNSFKMLNKNAQTVCPCQLASVQGTSAMYASEQSGIESANTIEISNGINASNGEFSPPSSNVYGVDTFRVGEYTLRNQIFKYIQRFTK